MIVARDRIHGGRQSTPAVLCVAAMLLAYAAGAWAQEVVVRDWLDRAGIEGHGFIDARAGLRLRDDPHEKDVSLAEVRLQLDGLRYFEPGPFTLRADLVYDGVESSQSVDLESGRGWLDLRECNFLFSPLSAMDVKLGRQILTWGTGDLLFINDLFPKDWVSFFIGRDEEYLKAPSDAALLSLFSGWANLDLVYVPRFDPDRYISGRRISYWSDALGRSAGRYDVVPADVPDDWFRNAEYALRLSRFQRGVELAAYAYSGYWKSPAGANPWDGAPNFPGLNVYGASARGRLGDGIASLETGYLDSRRDHDGDDPLVRNSEARLLLGYQRELARDFSATLQYYLEHMLRHDNYAATLPPGMTERDENRHVFMLRLTRLLMNQNLILGLVVFYSPSDQDVYLRPNAAYKLTDAWLLTAGGNIFLGDRQQTFFGQFEYNSNLYLGARYNF
ncbi:MAG: hypothetical protein ABR497_07550 [Kiritimatiellia bacterium]